MVVRGLDSTVEPSHPATGERWLPLPPSDATVRRTFKAGPALAKALVEQWHVDVQDWIDTVWTGQYCAVPPGRERWCTGPGEGEFATRDEFEDYVFEHVDVRRPERVLDDLCRRSRHGARAIVRDLRAWHAPESEISYYRGLAHTAAPGVSSGQGRSRESRPAPARRSARRRGAAAASSDDGPAEPPPPAPAGHHRALDRGGS